MRSVRGRRIGKITYFLSVTSIHRCAQARAAREHGASVPAPGESAVTMQVQEAALSSEHLPASHALSVVMEPTHSVSIPGPKRLRAR